MLAGVLIISSFSNKKNYYPVAEFPAASVKGLVISICLLTNLALFRQTSYLK
jgi:hypothetical protein